MQTIVIRIPALTQQKKKYLFSFQSFDETNRSTLFLLYENIMKIFVKGSG